MYPETFHSIISTITPEIPLRTPQNIISGMTHVNHSELHPVNLPSQSLVLFSSFPLRNSSNI